MCDFCKTFCFSDAACEVTRYGSHIKLAVGGYSFPESEQFNFCPVCGTRREEALRQREKEAPFGYIV